ncbi:hypothetical protein L596_020631 [Steinernema carpocapsae]|uniref:Uncharacterized protein n=1 Tax=Steinernema carpocapsae TaxID=34508 RepID=A0A4U5MU46_STECR|nr:hypothetical protein L596_020631 [Steinernema carpocapsae]
MDNKTFKAVHKLHHHWYMTSIKALMGQLGKELYQQLNSEDQQTFASCLDIIEYRNDLSSGAKCLVAAKRRLENTLRARPKVKKKPLKHKTMKTKPPTAKNIYMRQKQANVFKAATVGVKTISTLEKLKNIIERRKQTKFSPVKKQTSKWFQKPIAFFKMQNKNMTTRPSRFPGVFSHKTLQATMKPLKIIKNHLASAPTRRSRPSYLWIAQNSTVFRKEQISKNSTRPRKFNLTQFRSVRTGNKPKLTIKSSKIRRFPVVKPTQLITKKVTSKKKLKEIMKLNMWKRQKNVHHRFRRSEYRLLKSFPNRPKIKQLAEITSLVDPTKPSVIQRVSNLIVRVTQGNESNYHQGDWLKTYEELQKLKKAMDEKKQMPGAKAFDFRLYDLVLDKDKPSKSPQEKLKSPSLLNSALDLIESMSGREHKIHREEMNIRMMSPRIAPLMPDKAAAKMRTLSPSVLAFYKDVSDGSLKGEILEATERLSTAFEFLEKSFSHFQTRDIDKRGFTFMEPNQMERILKDHGRLSSLLTSVCISSSGVDNPSDVGFNMEEYSNLTKSQREESLWRRIELIAENRTEVLREKRSFNLISVLSPVILAPYMFNPIYGLSVLGPTILSPNIFSPLILNPSVLGPFILSPAVAMPFILSPYLLSPYILTPIVMAPFILNPYVLAPNVINPYVLSPLILSPLVLCPDLLSPQVLGGAILSPSVASPPILTESFLMGNVLSPSFLS